MWTIYEKEKALKQESIQEVIGWDTGIIKWLHNIKDLELEHV